jgi:hypothetical protein
VGIFFVSTMELVLVRYWIDWENEADRAMKLIRGAEGAERPASEETPLLSNP